MEVEEEAFIGGGGNGGLGEGSAVEEDRRGRAGGFPVGSAVEVDEAIPGGGNVEIPANDAGVAEAGSNSLRALDSAVGARGVVGGGGVDDKLAKDSVLKKPSSVEGGNLSKDDVGPSNLGSAPASHGAAAPLEKLDRAESAQAVNLSIQASVPAVGTEGEFLHQGHVEGNGDSSVQGPYASQQAGQREISYRSAAGNKSGEAPVNPNKQDADMIQEAVRRKMDLARSNTAKCDVYDGRWVFDESYPLYTSSSCPFVDEGFSCEANGRMEQNYTKWRWQPTHCNIPRCCISTCSQSHGC